MRGLRDSEGGVDRETHARTSEQQAPKDGFKKRNERVGGMFHGTFGVCIM